VVVTLHSFEVSTLHTALQSLYSTSLLLRHVTLPICCDGGMPWLCIFFAFQETLMFFPYGELLSARQRMQRSGTKFLDIKCGSLMQHKVLALQTDKVR